MVDSMSNVPSAWFVENGRVGLKMMSVSVRVPSGLEKRNVMAMAAPTAERVEAVSANEITERSSRSTPAKSVDVSSAK